jgi:hypothetical protein
MSTKYLRALVFFTFAIFGIAHADDKLIDPRLDPKEVISALPSIDCGQRADACRYIAAVESAAYFDVCPTEFDRRFGREKVDHSEDAEIMSWLPAWKSLIPATLKTAVLDPNNRLRYHLAGKIAEYLKSVPSADLGIECSRVGEIKMQRPAEEMSELLRATKNWSSRDQSLLRMPAPSSK